MKDVVPPLKELKLDNESIDLKYLLQAPYEDIREACDQIPAALGWLGHRRAMAIERLIVNEQMWKEAESKAYFELKGGGYVSGGYGEKFTEESLKRALVLADEVKAACDKYASSKRNVERLSSAIDALHAKLDLVRSSEVTRRMEHESDKFKKPLD
jgi:hypothetical protein